MNTKIANELKQTLTQIDRPGAFCVSGSAPAVLPGLEVKELGSIGLPLTVKQAKELKKCCEQAPYGKGEKTLVDTKVRRVWHLTPKDFTLTNPDWDTFLDQTLKTVQQGLGLEKQPLECHLYDLLLYEPGSFFLPHRDGEKLDRMVATLVIVLPSSFQGGELVVRHEGKEMVIDHGGSDADRFRIHYAAFYADCEHEIRPLEKGYRLCLVYNLTLKKGKKSPGAPRSQEAIEKISHLLRTWAKEGAPRKVGITLAHQYTQDGLTWETLKGADRAQANVLAAAAQQADWQAFLALLTLHESGSAEGGDYYGSRRGYHRRGSWDDDEDEDDSSDYTMGEIFETSLTVEHLRNREGQRLPLGELRVAEDELLDPEELREVDPEEEFEGYTGNAGMTLDHWYRHAAIFLWPNQQHFDVLCDAGSWKALPVLKEMVTQWQKADKKIDDTQKANCVTFAAAIMARWPDNPHGYFRATEKELSPLVEVVEALDDLNLLKTFLVQVLNRDAGMKVGKSFPKILQKHGWETFRPELESIFKSTTASTLQRNLQMLEQICEAKPGKKPGWSELCKSLAQAIFQALVALDEAKHADYRNETLNRTSLLVQLIQVLLTSEQEELLARLVAHIQAKPQEYPLTATQFQALTTLQPWLKEHLKKPSPPLSDWVAACCNQLAAITAQAPQEPSDFRRDADVPCKCAVCAEMKNFLANPKEKEHRFTGRQQRAHLEDQIRLHHCDLDCQTDKSKSPHVLICTKNIASFHEKVKTHQQQQERLATLRSLQGSLPK